MHHPGPPRFVAVGDELELAPRDPDPSARYRWRFASRPAASIATLGDDPVEHFVPDAPGHYVVELRAPDGVHRLTVRAFPGALSPAATEGESYSGDAETDTTERTGRHSGPDRSEREASDPPAGRPLLHLDARVEGDDVVVDADARPNPQSGERPADLTVEFLADDRDAFSLPSGDTGGSELRVPLDSLPEDERARIHAVAVGADGYSVPDALSLRRTDDGITIERPYDAPAWAEDSVIYEIYVRTFAGEGGASAFDAIEERLDYLSDLGVDTLWLTPVLENDHADHGYNITDFFSIATDLGGREAYEDLVAAAHERGMRVLFDLVLNHSARTHPFFRDADANPESPYREWYEWDEHGNPGTYFEWEHIANFEFDTLAVRRHLLDAVDEWAPLVDGFRCDMAWAVPEPFWRELRERVKDVDPEFLLLDETIPYIPDFQGGLFDMHFDSTTAFTLREVGSGNLPATAVLDAIDERAVTGFPPHASFMLYAENHDESRYVVECGDDAALAAAGAIATLPGAPMLYAGQELGQRGRRDALAWDDARPAFQATYERLLDARAERPALESDAALERIDYAVQSGDPERVVAYARRAPGDGSDADEDAVAVVLNFGADPATVSLDPAVDATELTTGENCATDSGLEVTDTGIFELSR